MDMTDFKGSDWSGDNSAWPRRLRTTRWSVVLAATAGDESAQGALGELYRAYFYPVYSLIAARRGREAAAELTQAFFVERMLAGKDLQRIDPGKCRKFRSWLYVAVEHYLANEWKARRRKRRDVRKTFQLDFDNAEHRYLSEPSIDPEHRYNRAWALCLLSTVIGRLRSEYCESSSYKHVNRGDAEACFDRLKAFLPGPELDECAYESVAAALGLDRNCVRQRVYRLRQRFGELLREHVSELVASEAEVDGEIQFLFKALELPPSQYELHRH
jgi:DNA-directed RNA polymerase specialized sigma24 family protein